MTEVLPDALPTNWVDRHAPPGLRPWLKLGRFDRPAGIWLLMLPGWMGIALAGSMQGRWPDPVLLAQFLIGAALMRAAGCAFNDIVDRDFDAQVARTAMRPIPAGQISVRQAWGFLIGCSLVGLVVLLTMNLWSVGLGVASLALVAAYPFMKRITWWPQAWLGLTFNWGAPLGFAAALGGPTLLSLAGLIAEPPLRPTDPWPAVLLYAGLVFWTLGYDTIYAVQDLEDDALAGVRSSARRLGQHTTRGVLAFYIACFCLVLVAGWVGGLGPLMLPPLAVFGLMLSRQAAALRLDDPAGALALFKSNVWAGAVLVAALVAGLWQPAAF
ncbi:MAG TPA: 4-hydroxybenzoate octaprenyltransferase [Caulobacter sp.]|nr:4-hydroxybenzoate octaprenyltransferase [Caulobacter sp.]